MNLIKHKNMKNNNILQYVWITSFLLLFNRTLIHAQNVETDPAKYVISPTAADLGKYGCIPVSYFTGQAEISIPLFSTEQLGIPFQMSLSYDGSGQLLNKLPGWTGHNWSLMAGGVITRVENGLADEWHIDDNSNVEQYKYGYFRNRGVASGYIS